MKSISVESGSRHAERCGRVEWSRGSQRGNGRKIRREFWSLHIVRMVIFAMLDREAESARDNPSAKSAGYAGAFVIPR
jgi:hypothetical protein